MTEDDIFNTKNAQNFVCEICDFKCSKLSNWNKHIITPKHKKNDNGLQKNAEGAELKYSCSCGKKYKYRQGLCKHKKQCDGDQIDTSNLDMNLIMQLLKQNDEFKALMVEQNTMLIEAYTNQGTKVPRTPP